MSSTYRAAVVGLGRIGCSSRSHARPEAVLNHVAAFQGNPRIRLVGMCDTLAESRSACSSRYADVPVFESVERMLEEARPEILSICTPTHTHVDLVRRALSKRNLKALFVEKPLASDLCSAEELVTSAASRGTMLAVNYTRHYVEAFHQLAREIQQERIGKLLSITGAYARGIVNNGSHWFDLAALLAGPMAGIVAVGASQPEVDDPTPDVQLWFQNGARGYLSGMERAAYGVFDMDLAGTHGRIELRRSGREIRLYEARSSEDTEGFMTLVLVESRSADLDRALPEAVSNLVAALDQGGKPRCAGETALAALRVSCAAVASLRTGQPVQIGESQS